MPLVENVLTALMKLSAPFSYPASLEKLDIDDNQALWTDYTTGYEATTALQDNLTADLLIIGGGFTGVSTAYHFSERYPDKRVVILEAKTLANGASGRNGGMMLNRINGTEHLSDEELVKIYNCTNYGIDSILNIIKKHDLQVNYRRDGSMEVFNNPHYAEEGHALADRLSKLGIPYKYLEADEVKQFINIQRIVGAVYDPNEGQLNGAQYVRGLRKIILDRGVKIYENSPVINIETGKEITVKTANGSVKAKAIVLATNGYTGKLGYFRKGVFPLHSHVFGTERLTPEQIETIGWKSVAGFSDDLNRLSYCSLTPDNRIVFGGGSNASYGYLFNNKTAFRSDRTHALDAMKETLFTYFPSLQDIKITHLWTGTLAISFQRNCSIGVMGEHQNIYYGLGYSGHGVTLANLAGEVITDIYAKDDEKWRGMPFYKADFAAIPMEPFRWIGYQMFTRILGRSPRI